jgi:hypothetical protein
LIFGKAAAASARGRLTRLLLPAQCHIRISRLWNIPAAVQRSLGLCAGELDHFAPLLGVCGLFLGAGPSANAGCGHRRELQVSRHGADKLDALHRKDFADLLEAISISPLATNSALKLVPLCSFDLAFIPLIEYCAGLESWRTTLPQSGLVELVRDLLNTPNARTFRHHASSGGA